MKNIFKTSLLVVLSCLMAGNVWADVIFSFTVTAIDKGSYTATGGTAVLSGSVMADDGFVIDGKKFYKLNSSSKWTFTLANNDTFKEGDVISFFGACKENKTEKGVSVNGIDFTADFAANTPKEITYSVTAGDAIIGKTNIEVTRKDAEFRLNSITITRSSGEGGEQGGQQGGQQGGNEGGQQGGEQGGEQGGGSGNTTPAGEEDLLIKGTSQQVASGVAATPGSVKTNLSNKDAVKLDAGRYFGLVLKDGYTFQKNDTFIINIDKAADLGKFMLYADNEGKECIYNEGILYTTETPSKTGEIKIQLPEEVNGKTSIYLWRTNDKENKNAQWNPTFNYIAVKRKGLTPPALTPVVTGCTFTGQKGTAVIVQGEPIPIQPASYTGGTITATIKYDGDLTSITPIFTGQNIVQCSLEGAQDFSQGSVDYTFTSTSGSTATYSVIITKADEVKPTSITLNKTELTLTEGGSESLTATVKPDDADNKAYTWESDDEDVATVDGNGKVTAVAPGTATITAKTKSGDQTAECEVTVEEKEEEGGEEEGGEEEGGGEEGGGETPQTDLTVHAPEVYENAAAQGGYGKALTKVTVDGKDREFEVYYFSNQNSTPYFNAGASHLDDPAGYELANSTTFNIGWLDAKVGDLSGSTTLNKEEFIGNGSGAKVHYAKVTKDHMIKLHVKGFDQFSFIGREAGDKDNKFFKVSINGVEQTFAHSKSDNTIYRFELKDGKEYYIEVTGTSSDENRFRAFSLRVANIPLVRHISGPKEQTVYQTDSIEQIVYRVRREKSYRLNWGEGITGIPGVTAVEGTNDTVFIQGLANAAAGTYNFTLEALDDNNKVASTESGSITIAPHIDDCADGNDLTTNVAEEMQPLNFRYYAMSTNDVSFTCDISGINIAFDEENHIATISGTPAVTTSEGPHTYTLSVADGNTITGTITMVVPNPIFEPITAAKTKDGEEITFYFVVHHAENVTITGLPAGFTVTYSKTNDSVTVTGTPNIGSGYPKEFEYTATATPRYAGKQSETAKGKLTVLDPNAKAIMVVTKNMTDNDLDALSEYLADKGYDITCVQQDDLEKTSKKAFGVFLITDEVDADNEDVLDLIRKGEKPVLNMKGFTYAARRLSWGEPDNGTKDTLMNHAAMIYVQNEHPIFESLNKKTGDSIILFDRKRLNEKRLNGVMPIKIDGEAVPGSYCLATGYTRDMRDYYADGPLETAIHEIPTSTRKGAHKYICLPLAFQSLQYMTDAGFELVQNIVDYLVSDQSVTIKAPVLQLNRLAIGEYEAVIDQENSSIMLELPDKIYDSLDSLRNITPIVELADPIHTHWTPTRPVDLMTADLVEFPHFAVSDYINRRPYEFKLTIRYSADRGLDEVYSEGDWITLYDIYGRVIATTNESIYTMNLPHGMYIAVTESGQSIKVMR